VIGNDDEFISENAILENVNLLDQKGINYELIRYGGTHKIDKETLIDLSKTI